MARGITAPGRLKFQRRCALIGQQFGTEGASQTVGQFYDLYVI
jgi:hypothetical protein